MNPILKIENLTKIYGTRKVVDDLSFSIFPGQIFGFIGPNGAGKSTTLKMITGLTSSNFGAVYIDGYSIKNSFKKAIKNVGAVIEIPQLYTYLSGEKNLKLFAKFYGAKAKQQISKVVKLVNMENRIKDKVSTYSLGMKQRLGIAQALLHNPKLLILDEPTNGLDPNGIVEVRNIIKKLAKENNLAILISSHNLAELEQVCDSICLINNGKMIDYKSMTQIKEIILSKQKVQLVCNYPNYASKLLKDTFNINSGIVGTSIIVKVKDADVAKIIAFLTNKKIKIYKIKKINKSLEELYLELLKKERPSSSII